jgi:hypothetical protein
MTEEQQKLLNEAAALRERALSPLQRQRKDAVQRRNEVIQKGVKAPKSGVFGKPAK